MEMVGLMNDTVGEREQMVAKGLGFACEIRTRKFKGGSGILQTSSSFC